jgi:protease-4
MKNKNKSKNKLNVILKPIKNTFKNIFKVFNKIIKYIQNYFKTFVFIAIVVFVILPSDTSNNNFESIDTGINYNTIKLNLNGMILSSKEITKQVKQIIKDDKIKAVIFDVNSPGGGIAPSAEISEAIQLLAKHKLVVAYGSGIMASGSYYASIYADKIFASKATIVGSIGVIINGLDASNLMKKIGIKSQVIKAGSVKEAGSALKAWNDVEKKELKSITTNMYNMFINDIVKARGLKKSEHKKWGDAHIFLASKAKKLGLIDVVGNIFDVEKYIHKELNLGEQKLIYKPQKKNNEFLEILMHETKSFISAFAFNKISAI